MKGRPFALLFAFLSTVSIAQASDELSVHPLGHNRFALALNTDVQADAWRVWTVLTDYDHHATFLPYMTMSRVTEDAADHKVVEQEGKIHILFWVFTMHVVQSIEETPPRVMRFNAIAGDFKILSGTWTVTSAAPTLTQLACRFELEPKRQVPEWAVRVAAHRYLSVMVKRLRARATVKTRPGVDSR